MRVVEAGRLFRRAVGEFGVMFDKEMYCCIESLNGEPLTLRPEGNAGCVRAVIQHNLIARQPQRLYYIGQMFRHERPQKGRYRQFHQIDAEIFGVLDAQADAEILVMLMSFLESLEVAHLNLQINSLGCPECRLPYKQEIQKFL